MRTFTRLFAVVALLALLSPAAWTQVALPHYDGFAYPAGSMLGGQGGWLGINSGDTVWLAAGNLTYPGFPTSTGNKITFSGAGQDQTKLFTTTQTGSVYFSYLLKVTSFAGVTTDAYISGFYQSATSTVTGTLVWIRADGSGLNIGVSARTVPNATVSYSTTKSLNTTYLIVGSYTFVSGAANDSAKLWINPDSSTFGKAAPAPTLTSVNTGTDLTGAARFLIRQDQDTSTAFIELDELRLGTTWADVTSGRGATAVNDNETVLIPRELRLEQNYPNPFNPSTQIRFTIPNDGYARVLVYNTLGQYVQTIWEGHATAGRYYDTRFEASGLTSGMYVVRLEHAGTQTTKKILLMK